MRTIATALTACFAVLAACSLFGTSVEFTARHQLLVVVDGLRPDYVTPQNMPHLCALGERGIVFTDHHAVFPTLTGVNAASIVTGAQPETHGLVGNDLYLRDVDPGRALGLGSLANLEAIRDATGGRLLTAPSLSEVIDGADKQYTVISFLPVGVSRILSHVDGVGAEINPFFSRPAAVQERVLATMPPLPDPWTVTDLFDWVVDAYLEVGLGELRSDVTILWLAEPDRTAHEKGVGAPLTLERVSDVDRAIGRLLQALEGRGMRDSVNVFVASDHGFSTLSGGMDLAALVAPFGSQGGDAPDLILTAAAIHEREPQPARVRRIVEHLQGAAGVGAIFTSPREPGSPLGTAPGTLSLDLVQCNHPRAGSILVSGEWSDAPDAWGYPGTVVGKGDKVSGHWSTSPFDIHATLIAAGPDLKRGVRSEVPTGSPDLAPTLLHLMGLSIPRSMDGRVLREALALGPLPSEVAVSRTVHEASAPGPQTRYRVIAHTAEVEGRRYFDRAEVRR